MDKMEIRDVRNSLNSEQKEAILNLWKRNDALEDDEDTDKRLSEIFAVAFDGNEKIVAISSSYQKVDPILKVKLHYIRIFVEESAREFKIGTDFIVFILNTLEREYDPNNKELPVGGAWIVENEVVKNNYKLAVSRHTQSIFYGFEHGIFPARVRYFTNAKIFF